MANIYDRNKTIIVEDLLGSSVSTEAVERARREAAKRGSFVYLDDDDGLWLVCSDGTIVAARPERMGQTG